ncbi:hypothetical protein MCOL2_20768, partial [Listeria fleischmannii FSL S10-1203]
MFLIGLLLHIFLSLRNIFVIKLSQKISETAQNEQGNRPYTRYTKQVSQGESKVPFWTHMFFKERYQKKRKRSMNMKTKKKENMKKKRGVA